MLFSTFYPAQPPDVGGRTATPGDAGSRTGEAATYFNSSFPCEFLGLNFIAKLSDTPAVRGCSSLLGTRKKSHGFLRNLRSLTCRRCGSRGASPPPRACSPSNFRLFILVIIVAVGLCFLSLGSRGSWQIYVYVYEFLGRGGGAGEYREPRFLAAENRRARELNFTYMRARARARCLPPRNPF